MNFFKNLCKIQNSKIPIMKKIIKCLTTKEKQYTTNKMLNDFLPDDIKYNVPKYKKNPIDFKFPLLINGAPKLDIKVSIIN